MDEEPKIKGNEELNQALKEFEAKSGEGQAVNRAEVVQAPEVKRDEVEGVKFETDNSYKALKFYNEPDAPKIVKLAMKWSGGLIKEQKQAEYVLFGFVVVAIAISLFLFFGGGSPSAEDLKLQKMYPPGSPVLR